MALHMGHSSSSPQTEVDGIAYKMLYEGFTEETIWQPEVGRRHYNELALEFINTFTRCIPDYLNFPVVENCEMQIEHGYLHLKASDLQGHGYVRGTDSFNRPYVAFHLISKINGLSRIQAICQRSIVGDFQGSEFRLAVSCYGEGALGHGELFSSSNPSEGEMQEAISQLMNGEHPFFELAVPTPREVCVFSPLRERTSIIVTPPSTPSPRRPSSAGSPDFTAVWA